MIKNCRICGREFDCYNKKNGGRGSRRSSKRPFKSVCCSHNCSMKNIDLSRHKRIERLKNGK